MSCWYLGGFSQTLSHTYVNNKKTVQNPKNLTTRFPLEFDVLGCSGSKFAKKKNKTEFMIFWSGTVFSYSRSRNISLSHHYRVCPS